MEHAESLFAENNIYKQLIRFFMALDDRKFDTMASILTQEGVWRRGGIDIRGRKMFLEAMDKRGADRHTRHVLGNVLIEMTDNTSAVATFYSTAWVHVGATDEKGVAPLGLPLSIGVYTATFTQTDEGWQIADLRSEMSFKQQG